MNSLMIAISGAIGGILCIIADLAQKSEASAIITIGRNLNLILNLPYANIITFIVITGIGVGLCFIFDVKTKQKAFYMGASVLAIMMTLVPYNAPPNLKSTPNSVKVNVIVKTEDKKPLGKVVVTLLDSRTKRLVGKSNYQSGRFYFYQSGGNYRMILEASGYRTEERDLVLVEGTRPISITVELKCSSTPIFLQRFFKK